MNGNSVMSMVLKASATVGSLHFSQTSPQLQCQAESSTKAGTWARNARHHPLPAPTTETRTPDMTCGNTL
jgi:hypothetical protein